MKRTNRKTNRSSQAQLSSTTAGWTIGGIAALCAAGLLFGWTRAEASASKLQVAIFNDESRSRETTDQRKGFGIVDALVDDVLPSGIKIRLYEFDRELRLFYDGTPAKSQELWQAEDRMTATRDAKQPGTYVSVAIEEAVRLAKASDGRVVALILWDGGHDGPRQLLERALAEAAQQPNLSIWVCGAKTLNGLYSQAKADFEGRLPHAKVTGPNDAKAGLDWISDEIR